MKKLLLLFAIVLAHTAYGQQQCGQDDYQQKIYNEDPSLRPENNIAQQQYEKYIKEFKADDSNVKSRRKGVNDLLIGIDYIIPVVVHVIHNNGPENISNKAVKRSIEMLNTFYAGESAFDNYIDPDFLSRRGAFDTKKLRFVLAKFDPDGNPTNGIDRQRDAFFTARGDDRQMRQNYHWPTSKYFNIYVVSQSQTGSGSSGFATFPDPRATPTTAYLDGHVMSAWAFGEHDEMWQTWYHNLAHEVGHWLNVQHIWANAGGNGDDRFCNQDDQVTDTPNTKGNNIKDLDDFPARPIINCSSKDNITNMMDYTGAFYAMFTKGQKTRMEAALNSTVSSRKNLWSTSNVLATLYGCVRGGADSDGDKIPNECDVCPNDAGNDSDGDGVCDSADLCEGYPDVNVDANPNAIDACDTLLPIFNFNDETVLSYDAAQDRGVSIAYDNGATLHLSVNSWKAIALNYNITPNTVIEFDFMSSIEGEVHYIGLDNDLELDPLLAFKLFGTQDVTASDIFNIDYNTYTDAERYDYKHYDIPIGEFFTGNVPYLFFAADNDEFNETWSGTQTYPGGGSYNDATSFFRNVKIYEKETLSNNDVKEISSSITLYPNPANNEVIISTNGGNLLSKMSIIDINGKTLKTINGNENTSQKINISEFSSGLYFINIESNKGTATKKLIKM